MEEKIVQFIERRFNLMFGIMFGIQIVGAACMAILLYIFAMAGGGLDILEFDPPGFNEACTMLPLVSLLTLSTFINYSMDKRKKWYRWLLIFTVIVNVILAVPLAMVFLMSLLIFSGL